MIRKKHYHVPRPTRKNVDLDGNLDTFETQSKEVRSGNYETAYKQSEHVPPPFKGEDGSGYVKKSEISLTWKVAGFVTVTFITVGIPVTWFASGLRKDIDSLSGEVVDMKKKSDTVFESSIRNEERLNNTEKNIELISKSLQSYQQNSPNNQTKKRVLP